MNEEETQRIDWRTVKTNKRDRRKVVEAKTELKSRMKGLVVEGKLETERKHKRKNTVLPD